MMSSTNSGSSWTVGRPGSSASATPGEDQQYRWRNFEARRGIGYGRNDRQQCDQDLDGRDHSIRWVRQRGCTLNKNGRDKPGHLRTAYVRLRCDT